MKIKNKVVESKCYVASDGQEFDSEWQCQEHERQIEQMNLEKETDDKLRFYTQANFPSMIDISNEHEYRLFLIKNEEDLDLFIKGYSYWFRNLERCWQVDKSTFQYPDIVCILDFPKGDEEYRLYRMSQLYNQFDTFIYEIDAKMKEKIDTKGDEED